MFIFSNGQTLYHKGTTELARITVGGPQGKNVTFVGAEGRVYIDNSDNYAPIIDESGVMHHGTPKIGEHVDFTLRKYITSMQERKKKYTEEILECTCG